MVKRKQKRLPGPGQPGYDREKDPEDHYSISEQYSDGQYFDHWA